MGPPGGGRTEISQRLIRHTNVISIDEFDEATMSRIFTSISDWHFEKGGYDSVFLKLGKVPIFMLLIYFCPVWKFYGSDNKLKFSDVSFQNLSFFSL